MFENLFVVDRLPYSLIAAGICLLVGAFFVIYRSFRAGWRHLPGKLSKREKTPKAPLSESWFWRALIIVLCDAVLVAASYFAALFMRFDFQFTEIERKYLEGYFTLMPFWIVATVVALYVFYLYHSVWRLVGTVEVRNLIIAYLALIPVYFSGSVFIGIEMPVSYYPIGFLISFCCAVALRFAYRFLRMLQGRYAAEKEHAVVEDKIMIIGAGTAAQTILREMMTSDFVRNKVCCIIDDNPLKKGRFLYGVEIVGDRYDILAAAAKYDITKIIYAIPSSTAGERRDILMLCKETGCKLQTIPGIYQLVNGEVTVGQIRDVEIRDLLGREQIRVDNEECFAAIQDKVVLVTGGGGSIGSELCRQVACAKPRKLIIFDVYENNAYDIQQELKRDFPELDLTVLIGSVRNTSRVNFVMEHYRPHLIFHAAAHKHVPLMEDSPCEAIKNNVFGTYKTAVAAEKWGVEKFILISTDKAVNPTNIMGASKRLCEMVVQMMERKSRGTRFVAVRFGNVLGSNGSVIPLFKKQIAQGGPVTITDKRIIRYFMTISEAVSLVLQASHYAKGGEIFVLDMGEPVKIDDMARNLIRLSGLKPDIDIKIEYTGLRPGEKLYEELLMDEEGLQDTDNHRIHIGKPIQMDDDAFLRDLVELDEASRAESDKIREVVSRMVPTYKYNRQ